MELEGSGSCGPGVLGLLCRPSSQGGRRLPRSGCQAWLPFSAVPAPFQPDADAERRQGRERGLSREDVRVGAREQGRERGLSREMCASGRGSKVERRGSVERMCASERGSEPERRSSVDAKASANGVNGWLNLRTTQQTRLYVLQGMEHDVVMCIPGHTPITMVRSRMFAHLNVVASKVACGDDK